MDRSNDQGPPGPTDYALLLALAAMWGSSFMLIKIGVETIPGIELTALRLVVAAGVMTAIVVARREVWPRGRRIWLTIGAAALMGNALPFSLISWAEERIDSGLAAILMAPMPLLTLLIVHITAVDERLDRYKLMGVLMGLTGLVVLIGPHKLGLLGGDTLRELAVAAAACCYALNAVVTKGLVGFSRLALVAAILCVSAAMALAGSMAMPNAWTFSPSLAGLSAVVVLGVVQTGVAYLVMLSLVRRQGAGFFSQVNFLIPLVGVAWGVAVMGERITTAAIVALVLILMGLAVARLGVRRALPSP